MSSYVSIGGTEAAMAMALKLKAAGDDFVQTAEQLANRIKDLEADRPWGDDEHGQAFYKNYTGAPEDGDLPKGEVAANEALRTSLHDAGRTLSTLGSNVVEGMAKYAALEAQNAADIKAVTEPT